MAQFGTLGIFVVMDEHSALLIDQVTRAMEIRMHVNTTAELRIQLISAVEQLLQEDFPRLIQALYRLDVDEEKLKTQLKNNRADGAAEIIADMIIERLVQKQKMKKGFGGNEQISEEEKW